MSKRKILVRGPALSRSGYGEHCRTVLRALRSDERNEIYLLNVGWGSSGWISEDTEERSWIDQTIIKTASEIQAGVRDFAASVQVQLPVEWQNLCERNIGVCAGVETTKAPSEWIAACKSMDKVLVPSEHSKNSFTEEVSDLIEVISFPSRNIAPKKTNFDFSTEFNFLTVAQWNPRKNVEQTITSFIEEFQSEEVGLILKLNIKGSSQIDKEHVTKRLQAILREFPQDRKCKVHLLHGSLTDQQMSSLYNNKKVSCYITTTHGEGFGLPVFEAAQHAVPIIAPVWGGIEDYAENFILNVNYEVEELKDYQVWEGVLNKETKWCFSKTSSVREKMREVYNNYSKFKGIAKKHQNFIKENFTEQKINMSYNNVVDKVLQLNETTGEENETE